MKFNRLLMAFAVLLEFSLAARADLASIFTNVTPAATPAIPRRTSIIFIQCHGLAPGDLSCYGQTNYFTPNFDRLAAEGIRFTRYTGDGDSALTTARLLSGKNIPLATGEANLAQRLQQSGYRTCLLGEWGLPGTPWTQGFDEFAGFLQDDEGRNYYSDFLWRYAPKSIYDEKTKQMGAFEGKETIYANAGGKKGKYMPDIFINAMVNFIKVSQPDFANHYRPFFLLLNLSAPRSAVAGKDDFPVPSDAPFTGEKWPQAAKNRAALMSRLDSGIGRVFEQLTKLGITNNIAIFLTSSSAPEPFKDPKMNFLLPTNSFASTNSLTHPAAPMLVWWPGEIAPGQVSDQAWRAVDFAPTAAQIGYLTSPSDYAGHSILPELKAKPTPEAAGSKP